MKKIFLTLIGLITLTAITGLFGLSVLAQEPNSVTDTDNMTGMNTDNITGTEMDNETETQQGMISRKTD